MTLRLSVLRDALLGDCTNHGISSRYSMLYVVNVDGPALDPVEALHGPDGEPLNVSEAVLLVPGRGAGGWRLVPAQRFGGEWVEASFANHVGPMFGGNFAYSSDSRWNRAIGREMGGAAIPIHDRFETVAQYDALSR